MNKLKEILKYYLVERQSKWNLLIVIVPVIGILIYNNIKLSPLKEGNYTIGFVTKKYWPIVSHKKIIYIYTVNGKKFDNGQVYSYALEGKRYLVQFSLKDNSISNMLQDIPVPDSIKEAPPEGWKELPNWARKIEK
ncbi:hypothetical protein [Chryseobacterium camelliae]|uniref:hypothetical protein n=1 Tax=Chryseobacterium camelliae TaxID=1265445 RepID=UPI002859D941|nr:hypothetical protein [Chryseobacterium camelliae]MDR6516414.1 hypothetical protein [Chryseobacterium camelliae]